jgi:ABC-2 type transport system ATP-binding protein/sodium transport system ATP-binding protein
VIKLEQLTKRYSPDILAVDRISFAVPAGEVYGLLGPNGAGKTTTLRMILGLLQPTSGDVTIFGHHVTTEPQRIKSLIGLVSASAGLYQWLTPLEVLYYFGTAYGLTKEKIKSQTEYLIETMQLSRFANQRCATLSTGQKQRVNLARALIHDPPVVLLDEPTRGLDIIGSQIVFDYVKQLRSEHKAVIVCTHQLEEAERLCDRFGLLYRGQLTHEGTLSELKSSSGKTGLVELFLSMIDAHDKHKT